MFELESGRICPRCRTCPLEVSRRHPFTVQMVKLLESQGQPIFRFTQDGITAVDNPYELDRE